MLVYFSYPMIGHYDENGNYLLPTWLETAKAVLEEQSIPYYNPVESLTDQMKRPAFRAEIEKPLPKSSIDILKALGLDPRIYDSYAANEKYFLEADTQEHIEHTIVKDLFVLCRADCLFIDGNRPSFGGVSQEVLYARQMGKLSVLVSNRICNTPWLTNHTTMTVTPNDLKTVLSMVLLTLHEIHKEADKDKE